MSYQIIVTVLKRVIIFLKVIFPSGGLLSFFFSLSLRIKWRILYLGKIWSWYLRLMLTLKTSYPYFLVLCLLLGLSWLALKATPPSTPTCTIWGKLPYVGIESPDTPVSPHLLNLIVIPGFHCSFCTLCQRTGGQSTGQLLFHVLSLGLAHALSHSRATVCMRQSYHWHSRLGPAWEAASLLSLSELNKA